MGFFDGVVDFVSDAVGGIADGVGDIVGSVAGGIDFSDISKIGVSTFFPELAPFIGGTSIFDWVTDQK